MGGGEVKSEHSGPSGDSGKNLFSTSQQANSLEEGLSIQMEFSLSHNSPADDVLIRPPPNDATYNRRPHRATRGLTISTITIQLTNKSFSKVLYCQGLRFAEHCNFYRSVVVHPTNKIKINLYCIYLSLRSIEYLISFEY